MVAESRRLLNTFTAAVQLPSDILVVIPSFLPAGEDLFAISQVCHRWRTVLVSFPLLWRRISCQQLSWTNASLERHCSAPLRLELDGYCSAKALAAVLNHGSRIASVSACIPTDQLRSFHWHLMASVEELALYIYKDDYGHMVGGNLNIRGHFLSLRRLLVSGFLVPVDKITAPNLIHLSLETAHCTHERTTVQSVLKMLRGCPRLETVLIDSIIPSFPIQASYATVTLSKLHSIELGSPEAQSGLVTFISFPQGAAVGFRGVTDGDWPYKSIQHVLPPIDIESITVAQIRRKGSKRLVRFEGIKGSLEILIYDGDGRSVFGLDGILFSCSPRLDDVKTWIISSTTTPYRQARLSCPTLFLSISSVPIGSRSR